MSTSTGQTIRKLASALEDQQFPRYIAIEGPMGVGKTTLAQRLAESLRYPTVLGPSTDNPFLDRFYQEGISQALPTQLFFLLHRARQVSQLPKDDFLGPTLVADFLIEKDRLFAQLTLDTAELSLYDQIHKSLKINPPAPDLVLYLQAPVEVLRQRIQHRGIDFEQNMGSDYLTALADAYTDFFHYYSDAPVLIVNAAEIDFANNDDHYELLVDQILKMDGTRQFFNPNPSLL